MGILNKHQKKNPKTAQKGKSKISLLLGKILDSKICQSKDYKTVYLNANYTLPFSKNMPNNSRIIRGFLKMGK